MTMCSRMCKGIKGKAKSTISQCYAIMQPTIIRGLISNKVKEMGLSYLRGLSFSKFRLIFTIMVNRLCLGNLNSKDEINKDSKKIY